LRPDFFRRLAFTQTMYRSGYYSAHQPLRALMHAAPAGRPTANSASLPVSSNFRFGLGLQTAFESIWDCSANDLLL
jgi:hypothetical protein